MCKEIKTEKEGQWQEKWAGLSSLPVAQLGFIRTEIITALQHGHSAQQGSAVTSFGNSAG